MADAKDAPQIIEHISKSVNFTPFVVKWVPCSARLAVMGSLPRGTGALQIYQMEHGKLNLLAEHEKGQSIKCATFGASAFEKRHLATGDYGGVLHIWDLENPAKHLFKVQAHTSIVNCIDGCGGLNIGGGAPELVTGSRDGCVRVWDPRQEEPVMSLEPEAGSTARDCWAVAFGNSFNDQERCVAAGYDNGDLKLLDLRMNRLLWETNVQNGIVSLQFDRKDIEMNKLLVTCLESVYRVYDMRTQHPVEGFAYVQDKAHKSTVWCGAHVPQNRELFGTVGGNGTLNLYKYSYPDQRSVKDADGKMKGVPGTIEVLNTKKLSDQPAVGFDWSADKLGLCALTCLDQTVKVALVTKLSKY